MSVMKMGVSTINDTQTFVNFVNTFHQVIVNVSATAWCAPCRQIAPFFTSLSNEDELASISFVKVDVDEAQDLVDKLDVASVPVFILFKDGKEVQRFSGADRDALTKMAQLALTMQ
jgi:thioredoxin 1